MIIRLRLSLQLFIRQTHKNISLHTGACPSINSLSNPMKLNVLMLVIRKISCEKLSTGLLAPYISVLNQTEKGLMIVLFQGCIIFAWSKGYWWNPYFACSCISESSRM